MSRVGSRVVLSMALVMVVASCARAPEPPRKVEATRLAMGSTLALTAWTADEPAARAAFDAVFADFERLEGLLSVWRPGSDVQLVNAQAGKAPVPVHDETREVLRAAAEISGWTDGKFDVTFGALSDIWKFDHDQDGRVPTGAEIAARVPLVDYREVVIEDGPGTVFIRRPGMRIHLGGIGKGYAVERAVAILRRAGLRDFLIQSGGDLYVGGRAGSEPWRLGIQDPRGPAGQIFAEVELADATFSTSGDYERAFVKDGVRYHHILDPATGQPARLCRSVTIITRRPTLADGLSTGVFILGPEKGMALVERLPDAEAVIVTADNRVLVSSGLEGKLRVIRPPTGTSP